MVLCGRWNWLGGVSSCYSRSHHRCEEEADKVGGGELGGGGAKEAK